MNIAFVSTAHIHTKMFLDRLAELLDGKSAYAIWDLDQSRGAEFAEQYGAKFYSALDDMLADEAVDGFAICSENTRHLPLLEKTVPLGKPVFCEKPLVTSTRDLDAAKLVLEKRSAPVICGYFQPFSGPIKRVSEIVESGLLGEVTRIRYRNAHNAAYGRWFDKPELQWFTNPDLSGGGGFMDMGTHAIHCVRMLFGPVIAISAEIRNYSNEYPEVDDFGIAMLRFKSGVLGAIEAGWTQTGGVGGIEVTGSKQSLWNTRDGYVMGEPKGEPTRVEPLEGSPVRIERLIAAIEGKLDEEELNHDLECCIDAVTIMEAAYESSVSGKWMAFDIQSDK